MPTGDPLSFEAAKRGLGQPFAAPSQPAPPASITVTINGTQHQIDPEQARALRDELCRILGGVDPKQVWPESGGGGIGSTIPGQRGFHYGPYYAPPVECQPKRDGVWLSP